MPNLSYEQRKAALIEEINAAFDGVERGEGVTLSEAYVIDDYGRDEHIAWYLRKAARKEDPESRWQDVPDHKILCCDSALFFLDAKGFHYYLPAYMTWYLRHIDSVAPADRSNTFDSLETHLYLCNESHMGQIHQREWFPLLNPAQQLAVARFIQFVADWNDARNKRQAEGHRSALITEDGMTPDEADAYIQSCIERAEQENYRNRSRTALNRFWGQFL